MSGYFKLLNLLLIWAEIQDLAGGDPGPDTKVTGQDKRFLFHSCTSRDRMFVFLS